MKKVMAVAVLGLFVLTACKKDYTCECTYNGTAYPFKYEKVKKSDAESTCDAQETTYKMGDPNATCTLK